LVPNKVLHAVAFLNARDYSAPHFKFLKHRRNSDENIGIPRFEDAQHLSNAHAAKNP